MSRTWMSLIVAAALTTAVHAETTPGFTDIKDPNASHTQAAAAALEIPGVTTAQSAALLEQINGVITGSSDKATMEELIAAHGELARQTQAAKAAYQAALGGGAKGDDVDALFNQVIDGKSSADPKRLAALAAAYETLYVQFGQFMNARFLASNRTGIPVYGSSEGTRAVDAPQVAQSAGEMVTSYQEAMKVALADLKAQLSEPAKH